MTVSANWIGARHHLVVNEVGSGNEAISSQTAVKDRKSRRIKSKRRVVEDKDVRMIEDGGIFDPGSGIGQTSRLGSC